jgi:hypothetical protein
LAPFYGSKPPPDNDVVPDWLLGGNRKRRVVAALASAGHQGGWAVSELVDELACGRSTVYEIVRALRPLGVLEEVEGRIRLNLSTDLGDAISALLKALEPFALEQVDRPPRSRS